MSQVGLGETRVVESGFPRVLGTGRGAVTGSGTQVALVVVRGGHERAAGGEGCRALLACRRVRTWVTTPQGPWGVITGGGNGMLGWRAYLLHN